MTLHDRITSLLVSSKYTGREDELHYSSIQSAVDFVSVLRGEGKLQPVSVLLEDDFYCLDRTVVIDNTVTLLTIEPYGNKRAKIIGGKKIEGFVDDTYNGKKCVSADVSGMEAFTDFFVNGKRAKMTRYPVEGYLYAEDVENHEGQLFSSSKWFKAFPGDIPENIKNVSNVQLSFCHYWIDEHTPIESYDSESRIVTMKYPSRFQIAGGKGSASAIEYYLENVSETFGAPDEWYCDNGRIYYIPRDNTITAESIEAYAPVIHKLFDIRGDSENCVRNIRLIDLDMGVTRGEYGSVGVFGKNEDESIKFASDAQAVCQADGAVSFRYASGCTISNCTMKNFGLNAFVIDRGSHNIRICGCEMYDGGAGGVKIIGGAYGCPDSERTFGNTVDDCSVTYCGRRYFAACGVLIIHSYENTVTHNEIGWLYYTGVSVGWVWGYNDNMSRDNIISYNHIHNLGDGMLSDMGGVYCLGKQPGTVVSDNLIHDITSKNYGGWALYTDEGSSYILLENNICYNTSDNSYHQHYGSMNTVRNNIFAFSDGQMIRVSRPEDHISILFERNIIYSGGVPIYEFNPAQLDAETLVSNNNLIYDSTGNAPKMYRDCGMEQLKEHHIDENTIFGDPCFADTDNRDFTLSDDSPAGIIGFKNLDGRNPGRR